MPQSLTTVEFLSYLRGLDVHLRVEEERLGCTAPKGVLTPALKDELKSRKDELLEFLRKNNQPHSARPSIAQIERSGYLSPSFGQQRVWFLEQLDPGSTAYNMPGGLRLRGSLDFRALENSLSEIIRRHEVLRTSILNVEGSPKMSIRSAGQWKLDLHSLSDVPSAEQERELARLATEEARRPFDLSSSPLIRACLVELTSDNHVLLVTVHHICADGWSQGVILAELAQLYAAYAEGKPSPLTELSIQYADYAQWQRTNIESGAIKDQVPYWKQKLRGPLPTTDLPLDRPRPPIMTFSGRHSRQVLPAEFTGSIQRFSVAEKVTPFITLLAAFKILLFRYTRQPDVIVGTAAAGRSQPELEALVGLFTNHLVLRTDLSGDPSVRTLLARVQETALGAFSHEEVPLDHLAELIQPDRDLSRSPLFQVMFIVQNYPLRLEIPGLATTPFYLESSTSRYELTVEAVELDGQFLLSWEYNADLFEVSTIESMQQHYQQLLQSILSNPEQRISELQFLTVAESEQMAASFDRSRAPYSRELCIHDLFEQQTARTPESIAVACGSKQLTYGELSTRSNRLANRLRKLGVGPEVLVGLCLDRSVETAVALLAVLKSGGAYVPIDPQYPPDRIAFMLQDSGAAVLITEEHLLGDLPANVPTVICVDRDSDLLKQASGEAPIAHAGPENLAYLIYTSGSTGKPKGVQITHRSVVNFLASMRREPGISDQDCLLAVTTLSFDIAGLEFYLPLVTGAQLVIAPRADVADGNSIKHLLQISGATMMQATPVTWRLLLESGWKGQPGLKILCGGEALPRELANQLLAAGAEVWNLYGPTETTIWSTVHRVDSRLGNVPIGKPIANTEIYVLDDQQNLVPNGVPGELYIGGDGLARGYFQRPELTAEKFVANRSRQGERLYRTGDLVRWLSDGNLEYLGRLDHQVKVRGFRIELGEIESALEQLPAIRQAVVVVREDVPGDQRLTAYVIAKNSGLTDSRALKEALLSRLPEYMVPSAFVHLDVFPLTPNQKVDRKSLPVPESGASVSAVYSPPRNDSEARVSAIWQDLLRNPRVGIHDNFFDLGGHSLLVVQLQNRIRQQLDRDISLVELFQRPTVASMAAFLNGSFKSHRPTENLERIEQR